MAAPTASTYYVQQSLSLTQGQTGRFIAKSSLSNSTVTFIGLSTPPTGVTIDSSSSNNVRSITYGNVSVPGSLAPGTYTVTVQVNDSSMIPVFNNINLTINVLAVFNVGAYTAGTFASGNNSLSYVTATSWMPLTLNNSIPFFGAATTMSCLFSGQSNLSRNRIDALQSQVNSYAALSNSALYSLSTNTTLYLRDFATEFNTFKGQLTSSLATTITALALNEMQDSLLQSSISQLSNVEGSLFSAIAQKASLMTENLTLAYTRNFVDVLLSVYPIFNSANGAEGGVCNVDDFFPTIVWGNGAPTLNEVSNVNVDAYMTPDVVTATANNVSSNTTIYNNYDAQQDAQIDIATAYNVSAASNINVGSGNTASSTSTPSGGQI